MRFRHCSLKRLKMEKMMRSTLAALTKQTMSRGASAHFHEAPFNDVGGAQLAPEVLRELEEGEQFRQVLPQLAHHGGVDGLPVPSESFAGLSRLALPAGPVNGLGLGLHRFVIPLPHLLQDVAHLVHQQR